jgi:MoxR-like ATPase
MMTAAPEAGEGNVTEPASLYSACVEEVERVIIGQRPVIDGAIVALLTDGHVLLEGVPGVAKTLLVRTLAAALDCEFRRVQFTPDLMPSDVIGSTILRDGDLVFRSGPVFTHFLLCDEINRAPAKTQSALLEAMQERAITAEGRRLVLQGMFVVFATQNPIEQEGTYPLPEAELDRFMMKLVVDYPEESAERRILQTHHAHAASFEPASVHRVANLATLERAKAIVRDLTVGPEMIDYTVRLTRATRNHIAVAVGVSPRAGLNLLRAAKAQAAISGRSFVIPDDVKRWAKPVLRHRLILTPTAEISGATPDEVIASLLESVSVPT